MARKLPTISGGSGPRFVRHTGVVACVDTRDDAGELIEADEMFGALTGSSILIAPAPFETISPETALARMGVLGVRAILSTGFEPKFYRRCISSGVLALPLVDETIDSLVEWAETGAEAKLTIDLDKQVIELPGSGREPHAFEVDPRVRKKLLLGLTDEEEMLQHVGSTTALRSEDRKRRPWLYGDS